MTENGFSLIEIAIVLVIVGLLLGMGAAMIGPLTQRAKNTESIQTVKAAVESVIGFTVISNNRLPDNTNFPGIVKKQRDSWQKPLHYIYDNNLNTNNVCGLTTTNITVQTSSTNINNVAFIILSGGGNYNNQTAGNQSVTGPTIITVSDPGIYIDNYSGGGDPNRVESYDDIIEVITLYDLKTKLGCMKYDTCSDNGIAIRNQSGTNLSYRLNGGVCNVWANLSDVTVTQYDSYEIYTTIGCTTPCVNPYMSYTLLKDIDIDDNCLTGINPGCVMVDR